MKLSMLRRDLQGNYIVGDSAIFDNKEEFANYLKKRYGLNKAETRAMEIAFITLTGWTLEPVREIAAVKSSPTATTNDDSIPHPGWRPE